MGYAKQFTRALRSNPFPTPLGLVVTQASIYLYRDAQPRPPEHFHSDNVVHNPNSPYGYDCISNQGTFLAIYTDHCSLKRDEPLWFHMDAYALDVNSCGFTWFHKTGGGGWGSESQNGDADASTLRALFGALRSFPADWERRVLFALDK